MTNTKNLIEEFIRAVLHEYPLLKIEYNYDADLDEYDIWHTNAKLEFYDKDFRQHIGNEAGRYLFNNNIYNFSFGYRHLKEV